MGAVVDLVRVTTRIEPDLQTELARRAEASERSVAAELRLAIRAWVDQADQKEAA